MIQRKQTDIKVNDSTIMLNPQRESDESVNSAQQVTENELGQAVRQVGVTVTTYVSSAARNKSVNYAQLILSVISVRQ